MREKTLGLTVDEWMGMYHIAADRADKAEAEVERLQTENARLRKVVEAANDGNTFALVQALAELDKDEEGQE